MRRTGAAPLGDALDTLERQVALAALHAAHLGAVDTENVGKRLLAEILCFTVGPDVPANGSL